MLLAGGSTFIDPSVVLYPLSIGTGANVSNEGNWSSVINKNLSIRFRSKFGKQSEGSISNYLRAISLAGIFSNYLRPTSIIVKVITKKKGGIWNVLKISSSLIICDQKSGLCDNFDQSCDHTGGGGVISQAEIECHHIGREPLIKSMGGHQRSL